MIVKLWRGRALDESSSVYQEHVSKVVFPKLEQLRGYVCGRVLRRMIDCKVELMLMTEWTSPRSISSLGGDGLERLVLEPVFHEILSDVRAEQFEVVRESAAAPECSTLLRLNW